MIIRVGHVPYLNMVPFYQGFGPEPLEIEGRRFEFWRRTPRTLGVDAEAGILDAAPLSLVDSLRMETQYEPIGAFGLGVKRSAQSVFLFSRLPMPLMRDVSIALTEETSTSSLLLQTLLEQRYGIKGVRYGRIASVDLYDGSADAVLLIGDQAIRTSQVGIPGLPIVTDLGEEWFRWQGHPFVFARWMVRRVLPEQVKNILETSIEKALISSRSQRAQLATTEALARSLLPSFVESYWAGFRYQLESGHMRSISLFTELIKRQCLIA